MVEYQTEIYVFDSCPGFQIDAFQPGSTYMCHWSVYVPHQFGTWGYSTVDVFLPNSNSNTPTTTDTRLWDQLPTSIRTLPINLRIF